MAKINAVEVHETRHSVELSPDEVRAAIEMYAVLISRAAPAPASRPPGATIKRVPDPTPVPPSAPTDLRLGGGYIVEWTSCHLPRASAPSIGRVYDGSSAGKLEMPQRAPVPPQMWPDDDEPFK